VTGSWGSCAPARCWGRPPAAGWSTRALVKALRDGPLAGAGIDVFGEEPPPADHPLFSLENVVLSPHTAASTEQAMRRMGLDAARGILDILGGADALNPPAGAPWQAVNPGFAQAGEREGGG